MINGINDNVEVYGRMFHVQTEVTSGARPTVRSTVYLDGAIVASRAAPVDPRSTAEEGLRAQVRSQHDLVIETLVKRTAELEARISSPGPPEARPRTSRRPAAAAIKEVPRPEPESDPKLLASLRVRQLIGPFSLTARPSPYHDPESVRARLISAAKMIDGIMAAPGFSDIRLDEQVRFFDLRERVAAWRGGGRDPETAAEILLAVVGFAGHLRRINDRRELVAFDHRLLTWALWAIGRDGASDEVLRHLRALHGRDAELDLLLDQSEPVEVDHLIELLLGLLDRTLPMPSETVS